MPKTDRVLRPDFVECMQQHDAWPKFEAFRDWARRNRNGFRNGVYGDMKSGRAVSQKFIVLFCEYLVNHVSASSAPRPYVVFANYLQSQGISNPHEHSAHTLSGRLFLQDEQDYLASDTHGIYDILKLSRNVKQNAKCCTNERQVREAIRWHYIGLGRLLEESNPPIPQQRAIELATQHMRIELPAYQEKAIAWWKYDRWTVLLSPGKGGIVGMSIVLPLHEASYAEVRNGKRMTYDTVPTDLQRPSRYLLVESCFETPTAFDDEGNVTKNLLMTIATQVAVLSRCRGPDIHKPLYTLCFAGAPKTTERIIANGYKPIGTYMPKIPSIEFYERVVGWKKAKDLLFRGFLSILAFRAGDLLDPPGEPDFE